MFLCRDVLVSSGKQDWNSDRLQPDWRPVAIPYAHSLLSGTQGWVAMRVRAGKPTGIGGEYLSFFEWADDSNDRIIGYLEPGADSITLYRARAGTGMVCSRTQTVAVGDLLTVVFSWSATQLKLSVNGSVFTTAAVTNDLTLAATLIDISGGNGRGIGNQLDSDVLWFACGGGTVTDADARPVERIWQRDRPRGVRLRL